MAGIRDGGIRVGIGIEIAVNLAEIHVVRNPRQEAEFQPATSERLHKHVVILIENLIILFHANVHRIKIDDHIRLGLERKSVFIKADVLHIRSC